MRTTKKELIEAIKKTIQFAPYEEQHTTSFKAACDHIWNRFDSEYNYEANQRRYPNNQERFKQWMLGQPLALPVYSDQLGDIMYKQWHMDDPKQYSHTEIENRFISLFYRELIKGIKT